MLCIMLIIFVLGLNRETFALQLFCELFVCSKQSLVYALSTDCWFVIRYMQLVRVLLNCVPFPYVLVDDITRVAHGSTVHT